MSGVTSAIKHWAADYAGAVLLALLLHALLLACVLRLEFTQMPLPKPAEPVVSYLYQPPAVPAVAAQAENNLPEPEPAALPTELSAEAEPEVTALAGTDNPATKADVVNEKQPATLIVPSVAEPEQHNSGLAQRALSNAATPSARVMEDAAAASYQQFLQAQQQPKMTVEKRHQELSADPAQQVVAQLDDGRQLIRTKGGCRIADPAKDGFDGLMAARMVPCGDEVNTSELLKQALEKHLKR